jgi:hypothetical protein
MLRRAFAFYVAAQAWVGRDASAHASGPGLQWAAGQFFDLVQQTRSLPDEERPAHANRCINHRVDYDSDLALCGARDCWQTPAETLALARGDCEDYAIAKYFLLGACTAAACPRLLYAQWADGRHTQHPRAGHLVLLDDARADDPRVLDCVDGRMLPLSCRPDLRPIFSFDTEGVWRGAGGERVGDAPVRLKPWRALLQRWAQQRRLGATVQ